MKIYELVINLGPIPSFLQAAVEGLREAAEAAMRRAEAAEAEPPELPTIGRL